VKNLNVFLDSPMAQKVTSLTRKHIELFDRQGRELVSWFHKSGHELKLSFTRSVEESMAINNIRSGAIIISASGMCTAGRILHHLRHGLPHGENTVIIAGFQAEGTLGRQLVDGAETIRIFGDEIKVRARIVTIGGFSAHADQKALMEWLTDFEERPRRIFITHGEEKASTALADLIDKRLGWKTAIPKPGEKVFIGQ
jgi:metallo-beta-lactamase family protein